MPAARWSRILMACLVLVAAPHPAQAQTETVEYYGLDAIGSVRVVFDASGAVVARLDYAPFGQELAPAPNAPDRKFAQLFRDSEAGLDYAQARSYQVRTGRFDTPDPIYGDVSEPQRWNRYSYALNAPMVFVDPAGLRATECKESNPGEEGGRFKRCVDGGGGGGSELILTIDEFILESIRFAYWVKTRDRSPHDNGRVSTGREGARPDYRNDITDVLSQSIPIVEGLGEGAVNVGLIRFGGRVGSAA